MTRNGLRAPGAPITFCAPIAAPSKEMAAKFEIYKSGTQYRWRLKAANGEIVASDEAYKTNAGAQDGIDAVKRAAAAATVDDTTDD